jgi:hypothetical protein
MDANTPATQSVPDDGPIEVNPIEVNPIEVNPIAANPVQDSPATEKLSSPARPKGPNAAAVVLGLVAIVLGGLIIASETMGLQVDWSRLGPGGIVGVGLVLVVLGAIGLVRRHDDL